MNFVFFSPHFPKFVTYFCQRLNENGAKVLGIGDVPFESLNNQLQLHLTDYYCIHDLENYEDVMKAVAFFTHKYGKIDRFESLNEHWIELEAKIRTDFNISGTRMDYVDNLKHKSKMRELFQKAGVHAIEETQNLSLSNLKHMAKKWGFPIVVKPNEGAGAATTYKLNSDAEIEKFLNEKPENVEFIAQEFIDGIIVTYDGIVDQDGIVKYAASHYFERGLMDVVNNNEHTFYYSKKVIEPEIEKAGRNVLKAYELRERFFHIEFFKRPNGKIYGLEVNMRPPGGWVPDAMNFANNYDVYKQWANMVVFNTAEPSENVKYCVGYASRKDHKSYVHNHDEIMTTFGEKIVNYNRIDAIFSPAMGNEAYQFRTENLEELRGIIEFIHKEVE